MKKIVVLGCGLVGSTMIRDLLADEGLTVVASDVSEKNLASLGEHPRLERRRGDLSNAGEISKIVADADAVVGAVPGRIGYAMLRTVIESGKPISDISFSPEDPTTLDELAKQHGVTAVVDCGVSPGLSNLAVGRAASMMDHIERGVIYVGGLPVQRHWPYEYRIVFSATDVIEEYTRPARIIEHGKVVVREALSEVELIDFPGVGTLEAFNTDGLRTLLHTVPADNMREKTLRYPGHTDRMRMLRETGFFSDEPLEIRGTRIVPRDLTEKLLFDAWKRPEDEDELTVLQVTVSGQRNGQPVDCTWHLLDRTDRTTGATSMARTTGFPCAIMARLLATGEYSDPGVRPPELFAANDAVYTKLLGELENRGVFFRQA